MLSVLLVRRLFACDWTRLAARLGVAERAEAKAVPRERGRGDEEGECLNAETAATRVIALLHLNERGEVRGRDVDEASSPASSSAPSSASVAAGVRGVEVYKCRLAVEAVGVDMALLLAVALALWPVVVRRTPPAAVAAAEAERAAAAWAASAASHAAAARS
jgi:hypothetical protein